MIIDDEYEAENEKSHRYNINRPWPRHRHKYTKYKICSSMMMVVCIKQHLRNIWRSIHEKVKQGAQNQNAHLIETQLEKLLFVLYYLNGTLSFHF